MDKILRIPDDLAEKLRVESFRLRVSQTFIINSLLEKHFTGSIKEIKTNVIRKRPARSKVAKKTA